MKVMSLVFSLFVFGAAHAGGIDSWSACTETAQCIKAGGVCGMDAINKKFEKEHDEQVKEARPLSSCRRPTPQQIEFNKNAKAVCEQKKCVLK
jgi:hypothetical protein